MPLAKLIYDKVKAIYNSDNFGKIRTIIYCIIYKMPDNVIIVF